MGGVTRKGEVLEDRKTEWSTLMPRLAAIMEASAYKQRSTASGQAEILCDGDDCGLDLKMEC